MNALISKLKLLGIISLYFHGNICIAQQCSRDALTAKYWQYRDNLNKHFVLTDRRPEGCVGDGIHFVDGVHPNGGTSPEHCGQRFLSGYSLPATSINQTPSGAYGMGERNDDQSAFFDQFCADAGPSPGTNWDNQDIHNYLEMGEETPHQMQWYWTTLATEYALLIQNKQFEEAQRTLEELYLGLQAYRRMDMLANCMAQERYEEITADFEVEGCGDNHCLCGPKYVESVGAFNENFKTDTQDNCPFQADMSGYTGFSLREDGTQALEALNDLSEDKWNIDLVSGDYAMSGTPCSVAVSQACYNVKGKNFLSQDQMYALMQGLVMIKRYIPASATVTTCDGTVENVLSIAQNIGKGLVDWPNHDPKRINWPGAKDCCDKEVHISFTAGGYMSATYAGLEMMYNYVSDNDDRYIDFDDRYLFNALGESAIAVAHSEGKFWQEATFFGQDIGDLPRWTLPWDIFPGVYRGRALNSLGVYRTQIYGLINNLLYPGGYNVPIDKGFFEALLCKAPCGGPCQKPDDYDEKLEAGLLIPPPVGPIIYPDFECANTPDWTGQRWEGLGGNLNWDDIYQARQFNGLDYMALYNIYMLTFPEEQTLFYNPDRPEPTKNAVLFGENKIEGPTTLCPGQTGSYLLELTSPNNPSLQSILWESSSNISVLTPTSNPTDAKMNTAESPSYISVSFQEVNSKQQYENGIPQFSGPALVMVEDKCDFTYQKLIVSEAPPEYTIVPEIDKCKYQYWLRAIGPAIPEELISWEAENYSPPLTHGTFIDGGGTFFNFENVMPLPHHGGSGTVHITLYINTDCGTVTKTFDYNYTVCPLLPPGMQITPNPGQNQISIRLTQNGNEDYISTDPNGVKIQIYPVNGGTNPVLDSYLYSNGQYFNVSSLPNGIYNVKATAADFSPIQANLSIIR